jgi:hypothetical protein
MPTNPPSGYPRVTPYLSMEPQEEPYGTIRYSALDPEGHLWLFSEQIREPDPEWSVYSSAG